MGEQRHGRQTSHDAISCTLFRLHVTACIVSWGLLVACRDGALEDIRGVSNWIVCVQLSAPLSQLTIKAPFAATGVLVRCMRIIHRPSIASAMIKWVEKLVMPHGVPWNERSVSHVANRVL